MALSSTQPPIAYSLVGPEGAPALVFVGGMGSVQAAWFNQVKAFSADYRVLTYDHRAIGESPVPPRAPDEPPITMADYADDLARLLDALRIASASLVGLSFGGRVLQQLALDQPERVQRLVLGGTSCGGVGRAAPSGVNALRAPPLPDPEAEQARWEREILPVLFGSRYRAQFPERMRSLARWRARHPTDPTGLALQWTAWSSFDVCERLRFIRAPTLVLHGAEDGIAPVEHGRRLAEGIPGARLELLDGVGHSPNIEDADGFNARVRAFLTERG